MAVFAMNVSTTIGADVISINFGSKQVDSDSTGDVGGVTAAYWTNVTGVGSNLAVKGSSGTTYDNVLTVATTQSNFAWQSGIADAGTVLSDVQSTYMDLSANNTWTITLNLGAVADAEHSRLDVTIYLSGDGSYYSPVSVGGTSYIGGTNVEAGSTTSWGDRSGAASATQGDHNTITVTGVASDLTITNVPVNSSSMRATLAGMQIKVTDIYTALLTGNQAAEDITWEGPNSTSAKYTDIAAAERYLRADVSSGNSTLTFAAGADIAILEAKGGNVLSIASAGEISVGEFSALEGSTLSVGDVLADSDTLKIGGTGTVLISESQTLAGIAGSGATLSIADGVKVMVNDYSFSGTVVGGEGSALNISLSKDSTSTVNGISVTNKLGDVSINALADGVTDVTASDGARIGISSTGGTLVVNATAGSTVTLTDLALTANADTRLTTSEGVSLVGSNLGQFVIDNTGRALTVGEGVSLTFSGSHDNAGNFALCMGNGTLNIAGGSVTADSLIMQNYGGNKNSAINITDGGILEITGTADSAYKSGCVRLGHWSGTAGLVNVADGEFRVAGATISMSDDGQGNLVIGSAGVANLKGISRLVNGNQLQVNAGGKLNIGVNGISTNGGVINVDGGTLGALATEGWSSSATTNIGNGATIQLGVYDLTSGEYSGASTITLSGTHTGTGALTLAGDGRLVISSALGNDVSLAEGAGATLAVNGLSGFEASAAGALSGYGDSTTDGYASGESYVIAGAGSTLDKVTVLTSTTDEGGVTTTTEAEYDLIGGVLTLESADSTSFYVNTDVTRSLIDEVKEGTTFSLAAGSSYHTNVVDDLGAIVDVADSTAAVYLQNEEGKDLLKITNLSANWKPNITIEGNDVVCSAGAYTADFTILSGATVKQTGNDTAGEGYDAAAGRVITVADGGTFDINGHEAYYHVVLEEGATLANYGGAVGTGGRNLALVELTGDATVDTDSQLGVVFSGYNAAQMHLNGNTLTKTGSGVFHINNCTTDAGTIRIEEGKVLWLEYNGPAKTTTDATTFVVCSNEDGSVKGTLQFGSEGRSVGAIASLVAEGGNVNVDASRVVTVLNSLTGSSFTKQGTGSLALNAGMVIADDITATVEQGAITLSTIGVAEGKTFAIAGAATADVLTKTGAGALTVGTLTANVVNMAVEGTLGISTLGAGTTLSYTAASSIATIETLAGNTVIDIIGMVDQLSDGVNLGIKYSEENLALINVVAVEAGTWELVDADGYIKLQGKDGASLTVSTDWDINWGGAGLAGAPAEVAEMTAETGNISLALAPTKVIGGGDSSTVLAGGKIFADKDAAAETIAGESWISISGGTFDKVIGGNICNNWGNSSASNFEGDSHIMMTGGTTAYVIGGNFNDAKSARFIGDTYVSIFDGATVSNSVVGGSTMSHNAGMSLTGNTNVFIYTPLTGNGHVLGGHMYMANSNGTMTLDGNTNVTIDLSAYEGSGTTFAKNVAGASYLNNDPNWGGSPATAINGDTHVTIVGKAGVSFNGAVAGGSLIESPNSSTISGSTNINISGASEFNGVISGGTNFIAWESGFPVSNIGATNVTISGGTFYEKVMGGDSLTADGQMKSTVGAVTMTISGGTFNANVFGGSYKGSNGGGDQVIKVGSVTMNVSGGTMTAGSTLLGGSWLSGTGSQSLGNNGNLAMGDISLTITGGSWQDVVGGTYIERNNSHYMAQGNIVVDLQGGTVAGDVYAGGKQVNRSYLTTESTTVKIGSGVTLTDGKTVSAGYNTTQTNSTIAGDRTILFTGDDQDRSGVVLKDFNKIGVETEGKTATVGALTCTEAITVMGDGTLKMGAASSFDYGVTVDGTLDLNGQTVTGDVTVNGGLITGGAAINGTLTVTDGAAVSGAMSATDIALGSQTLTDAVAATGTISVGSSLTTSADVTAQKITGEGSVAITGGTVTLTDTTEAFENAGGTSISGATLAGTWTSDSLTLGQGNSVATGAEITLSNANINSGVTNNGTLNLSGEVTLGSGITVENENTVYTADDNGYKTTSGDYVLASGGTTNADGVTWVVDGSAVDSSKAEFNNGKLTVTGEQGSVYYVRNGEVSDATIATSGKEAAGICLSAVNGGSATLQLAATPTLGITVQGATGNVIKLGDEAVLTAGAGSVLSVESGAAVSLIGSGSYDLGTSGSPDTGVSLGSAWAGTVLTGADFANTDSTDSLCLNDSTLQMSGTLSFTETLDTFNVAGALTLGEGFTLSLTDALLESMVDGETKTLVMAGNGISGTITNVTTDGFKQSEDGNAWGTTNKGGFSYQITTSADGSSLTISKALAGNGWDSEDGSWKAGYGDGWATGVSPDGNEIALFNGNGTPDVTITGEVTPNGVSISGETSDYIFSSSEEGGSIASTDGLNIIEGSATFSDIQASFEGESAVGALGNMVVSEGATVEMAVLNNEGTIDLAGSDDVAGMTVTEALNNMGTITLKEGGLLDVTGLTNSNGGSVVLDGGELLLQGDSALSGVVCEKGFVTVSGALTSELDEVAEDMNMTVGSYEDSNDTLEVIGTLTVKDEMSATTLTVEDGAVVVFEDKVKIDHMKVMGNGYVVLGRGPSHISPFGLRAITPGEPSFIDNMTSSMAFEGAYNEEGIYELTVTPTAGGLMSMDATNAIVKLGTDVLSETIELTAPSSMTDGELRLTLDLDTPLGQVFSGEQLALNGTDVIITQKGDSVITTPGTGKGIVIAGLNATEDSELGSITLQGAAIDKYYTNVRLEGGSVVADRNTTYASDRIEVTSANGAAGVELLDSVLVEINPQADREATPVLAELMDMVEARTLTDEDAAAVAGSSIATVGMALSGDVDRQLRTIRNRTTTMGVSECVVNEGMPYFNAWVQAEANRAELDRDGTYSGYVLDSWGGTVGFDVDLNDNLTMGLAITAMYGDLQADAPDMGEGDMDTYYVSLFARYAESAWTHTFVATVGTMEGTFNRTVNVGNGYKTEADTEGMSFGLMYEVGYVMPLDEDATACLQPIFNVTLRHSSVDGYTEEGSDAALDVGSQDMTTLTFGLGARMQAVVGESVYNRASIFEARAMAKLDVGDRSSEADVAFAAGGATSKVESAELGAFGVELGAGLTIPVGDDDGSIFVDGSVELRSGYTNYNGTVGYRINF